MAANHLLSTGNDYFVGVADDASAHTADLELDHMLNDYFGRVTSSPTFHLDGKAQSSSSQLLPSSQECFLSPSLHYNQNENASPETVHTELGDLSFDSPSAWRLTNAVHMEVQENAKIPTFNWNIDRSNSVSHSYPPVPTSTEPHLENGITANNLKSNALSLGFFLREEQKRGRTSSQASYAYAGVLKNGDPRFAPIREKEATDLSAPILTKASLGFSSNHLSEPTIGGTTDDDAKLIALTGDVYPTPLSEIKRKNSPQNFAIPDSTVPYAPSPKSFQFYVPRPAGVTAVFPTRTVNSNQTFTALDSNTSGVNSFDSSIKTKANPNPPSDSGSTAGGDTGGGIVTGKFNTMASTETGSTAFEPILDKTRSHPHHHDYLRLVSPPIHAVAHSSVTAAILNASKQKSQYGFGTRHKVPSIPTMEKSTKKAPAASRKAKQLVGKGRGALTEAQAARPDSLTSERPSSATSAHSGQYNSEAYERKKARAKNARVLLNDSIDRLAVAINLAGSQSEQRIKQVEQLKRDKHSTHHVTHTLTLSLGKTGRNNDSVGSSITANETDKNILGIIKSCTEIAEQAKKWDRPSFVGYSATMITALNAQCEALTRELVACHLQNVSLSSQLNNLVDATHGGNCQSNTSHAGFGNVADITTDFDILEAERSEKRRRMDSLDVVVSPNASTSKTLIIDICGELLQQKHVMERIVSFLDIQSKTTCLLRVAKAWKRGQRFGTEQLWSDLSMARFGSANVRQWRAKMEHVPEEEIGGSRNTRLSELSSMSLYRVMDEANVIPLFGRSGNMIFLGESRLPGKVSAWAFLIERSNGETMRSVKRPFESLPSTKVVTNYVTLPIVQLWTIIQNTAIGYDEPVVIREQSQCVDASTRRRKDEMKEVDWDDRFQKRLLNLDFSPYNSHKNQSQSSQTLGGANELCRLGLFDGVIIETSIHAKGCTTTSKFIQRSNYTEILVQVPNMTTVPLVIPFPRDITHLPL